MFNARKGQFTFYLLFNVPYAFGPLFARLFTHAQSPLFGEVRSARLGRCIIAEAGVFSGPGMIQARNPPLRVQTPHRRADVYADPCQDLSALSTLRCVTLSPQSTRSSLYFRASLRDIRIEWNRDRIRIRIEQYTWNFRRGDNFFYHGNVNCALGCVLLILTRLNDDINVRIMSRHISYLNFYRCNLFLRFICLTIFSYFLAKGYYCYMTDRHIQSSWDDLSRMTQNHRMSFVLLSYLYCCI